MKSCGLCSRIDVGNPDKFSANSQQEGSQVIEQSSGKTVRTICPLMCGRACGIMAHVQEGKLVKVEPVKQPGGRKSHICVKGLCTPQLVYHPDRLKYPVKRSGERGSGRWQRISWDEALETTASRLKEIARKYGPESVAWALVPMGALHNAYQRLASTWGGTWVLITGFGDAAGPCADAVSYGAVGSGAGMGYTTSFENPGLCVSWGENMAETALGSFRAIRNARERGAKVIVIDPRFTPTAARADEWLPIRPGTDSALALAMIDVILKQGLQDDTFIINHTVGPFLVRGDNGLFLRGKDISLKPEDSYVIWDAEARRPQTIDSPGVTPALRGSHTIGGIECKPAFQLLAELAEQYHLEKASRITEIAPDKIERLALEYARRKPVASWRGYGVQRTFHGDLSWRAITALAAVTGNISLTPVCGFVLNWQPFVAPLRSAKTLPIMNMFEAIRTGKPHPIKAMCTVRLNPANQMPDANKMVKELLSLDFLVVVDMFMSATAAYADIVLPACTHFECLDFHPRVPLQLQQKVIEPLYESRSDFQIAKGLASKLGVGEYFKESEEETIELLLTTKHPSVEGITLEKLREGPIPLSRYPERVFHTPSGRLEFYSENPKLKELGEELPVYKEPLESARSTLAQKYPLSLLTTHTKYRLHSMFTNVGWMTQLEPEPLLEMNPADAEKRGIQDGDMVIAFNDRGRVKVKALVHEGIKPGVVNITQGWWPKHFAEGSHQTLTHDAINPAQQAIWEPNSAYYDVLVEVKKAEEK